MNYSTGNQTCYHSLESPTPVSIFIKNRDKVHKTWIFKNSKDWFELRQGIDSKKNTKKGKTPSNHHLFSPQVFQKKHLAFGQLLEWRMISIYTLLSEKKTSTNDTETFIWSRNHPAPTPSLFPQILVDHTPGQYESTLRRLVKKNGS